MIVKAANKDEFLGFVEPFGKPLPHNVQVFLEDEWLQHKAMQALVDAGDVVIVQYGTSGTEVVTRDEYLELSQGIYKGTIAGDANGITSTNPMVLATLTSVTESAFDFDRDCKLAFNVDSLVDIVVSIPKGFYTQATLAALIQADSEFAEHLVAAAAANAVKITGKTYGVNAKIEIVAQSAIEVDANTVIAFPAASAAVVTAEAEVITVTAKGATGEPAQNAGVKLTVHDAGAAGNPVNTCQFQRITKGVATLYSHELVSYTDGEGEVEVEIIDPGVANIFVQLDPPSADYFLANTPSARVQVVVTQV
jgi:hypothetical protein